MWEEEMINQEAGTIHGGGPGGERCVKVGGGLRPWSILTMDSCPWREAGGWEAVMCPIGDHSNAWWDAKRHSPYPPGAMGGPNYGKDGRSSPFN